MKCFAPRVYICLLFPCPRSGVQFSDQLLRTLLILTLRLYIFEKQKAKPPEHICLPSAKKKKRISACGSLYGSSVFESYCVCIIQKIKTWSVRMNRHSCFTVCTWDHKIVDASCNHRDRWNWWEQKEMDLTFWVAWEKWGCVMQVSCCLWSLSL